MSVSAAMRIVSGKKLQSSDIVEMVKRTQRNPEDIAKARAKSHRDVIRYRNPQEDAAAITPVPLWHAIAIYLRSRFCDHKDTKLVGDLYAIGATMGFDAYADRLWRSNKQCPHCGLSFQKQFILWRRSDWKFHADAYDETFWPIDTVTGERLPINFDSIDRTNIDLLPVLRATWKAVGDLLRPRPNRHDIAN